MARFWKKTKAPNSVGAGQTAIFDLSTVDIYHSLLLTYTTTTAGGATRANMEAELTQFRLLVNGVVQRVFTATELFAILEILGIPVTAGEIPIFFSEPWRRTLVGEDLLAWPMGDLGERGTFHLEVDIAAGAFAPTLKAVAAKDFGNAAMGPIVKWRRHNINAGAGGDLQWYDLPPGDSVYALHCFTNQINSIRIETDGVIRYDLTKAEADKILTDYGWTPSANIFSVMFDYTGRHEDAQSLIDPRTKRPFKEVLINFNMAGAANFNIIGVQIGQRD